MTIDEVPEPAESESWLRGQTYRRKYSIGSTTFWEWRRQGRIETRKIGGCVFVRDRLPEADTSTPK